MCWVVVLVVSILFQMCKALLLTRSLYYVFTPFYATFHIQYTADKHCTYVFHTFNAPHCAHVLRSQRMQVSASSPFVYTKQFWHTRIYQHCTSTMPGISIKMISQNNPFRRFSVSPPGLSDRVSSTASVNVSAPFVVLRSPVVQLLYLRRLWADKMQL